MPDPGRIVVRAPGKLNLFLDITGTRADAFHTLDGVMLAVDLSDLLVISLSERDGVTVSCTDPALPVDGGNLAVRAATAFFSHTGLQPRGLSVHIDKRIPTEAGLAGGSADAAAVLVGLDHLLGTALPADALREIALDIGSDVPFCVTGGCARARGRGELLEPLPTPRDCWFTVVKPCAGMSTGLAFSLYDKNAGKLSRRGVDGILSALSAGDLPAAGAGMYNIFEQICAPAGTAQLKSLMLERGALGAVMSGSGTAIAGLFDREESALGCLDALRSRYRHAFLARPLSHGSQILFTD